MEIKYKKLNPNAQTPQYAHEGDACLDLYACIDKPIEIYPHCTEMIGTGLAFEVPIGYFGAIFPRSGLATKEGLRVANCTGVCDAIYRGEYIVAIHNDSNMIRYITPNERIAQLTFLPVPTVTLTEVEELSETDRGAGGFGSTGK